MRFLRLAATVALYAVVCPVLAGYWLKDTFAPDGTRLREGEMP